MASKGVGAKFSTLPVFWGWRSDSCPHKGPQNTGYAWAHTSYGLVWILCVIFASKSWNFSISWISTGIPTRFNNVRPTPGSRFSRYRVMVNSMGVFNFSSTILGLFTKALNLWKTASLIPPQSSYLCTCIFYFYHLSRVIVVCTSLGLKNNRSMWTRA